MAYTLVTGITLPIIDSNGNPVVGGSMEFYEWNNSTPVTLYSDSSGTVLGTSCLLNSRGLPQTSGGTACQIFANDQIQLDYKIVVKDAAGDVIPPTIGPLFVRAHTTSTVVEMDQYFPEIRAQDVRIDGISTLWNAMNVGTALHMLAGFADRIAMFKGSGVNVDGSDLDCDNLTDPQYYKIRNIQNMPTDYTQGELVVFQGKDEYLQMFYRWDGTYEHTVQFRIYSGAVAQWTPWLMVPVVVDTSVERTGSINALRTEGSYSIGTGAGDLPTGETRGGLVVRQYNSVLYQHFYGYSGHVYERVLNGGTGLWSSWRRTSSAQLAAYTGDLNDLRYFDYQIQCSSPTNRPGAETDGCLDIKIYINYVIQKWYGVTTGISYFRIFNGTTSTWGSWIQESN